MTEDHTDHDHHPHESDSAGRERTTAPQQAYTTRQVAVGAAIGLVGLLVVFAVPLLLA